MLETNPLAPADAAKLLQELRQAAPRISLVVYHLDTTRVMRLAEGQALVVGRDPAAEICIGDTSVSRQHARFELRGGAVSVRDLGSTNGTRLNGELLDGPAAMGVGDEVTLGNVTVAIHARAPLGVAARRGRWTHDQFLAALEDEVERARTFHRGLAVVLLKHTGDAGALAAVQARLRSVDRAAGYGEGALELLLPEAGAAEARALLEPLGPAVACGVAVYPDDGGSSEALLEASREAMRRASAAAPVQLASGRAAPGAEHIFVSPVMRDLFDTAARVATAVVPVLIRGETGTGKEVLARAIHQQSPRGKHRLVAINCGAIPPTLVESVLFGHERGAFTGATGAATGVFEEAAGGTVLLDEVGELSPASQAALLRVLETKQVRRVGASRETPVDVRVIAATHRDLEAMVKAGTFREDLLYRLNTMTLEVPPLRERPEEIGPFADRFLALANAANGRQVQRIDAEAMRLLLRYPWPGNIRELRNAIEHAVVVARGSTIEAADLPRRTRDFTAGVLQAEAPVPSSGDLREGVQRYETQVILEALRAAKGNRTEAARRLQIPVRTLSHKLKQCGIKKLGFGLDEN